MVTESGVPLYRSLGSVVAAEQNHAGTDRRSSHGRQKESRKGAFKHFHFNSPLHRESKPQKPGQTARRMRPQTQSGTVLHFGNSTFTYNRIISQKYLYVNRKNSFFDISPTKNTLSQPEVKECKIKNQNPLLRAKSFGGAVDKTRGQLGIDDFLAAVKAVIPRKHKAYGAGKGEKENSSPRKSSTLKKIDAMGQFTAPQKVAIRPTAAAKPGSSPKRPPKTQPKVAPTAKGRHNLAPAKADAEGNRREQKLERKVPRLRISVQDGRFHKAHAGSVILCEPQIRVSKMTAAEPARIRTYTFL